MFSIEPFSIFESCARTTNILSKIITVRPPNLTIILIKTVILPWLSFTNPAKCQVEENKMVCIVSVFSCVLSFCCEKEKNFQ